MKYMGSKARIADELLRAIFQNSKPAQCFYDLFCGSCSVISRVPETYNRVANDKNVYLIEMFRVLRSHSLQFPLRIEKELYAECRQMYHEHRKGDRQCSASELAMIGWVGWMGSFNGRFFSGGYSGHEVQIKGGKVRDYIGENIRNTLGQLDWTSGVTLLSMQYDEVEIPDGSIVYCDIPYRGTKQYETSKDFDYDAFYEWCRWNKDRLQIFVSEYAMPDDFTCIWEKKVTTALNQTNTYKPTERLFVIR